MTAPTTPLPDSEQHAWNQRGFVLVSKGGALPFVHSFHLPQWQAENARHQAEQTLPAELRDGLVVVPAILAFQFPISSDAAV